MKYFHLYADEKTVKEVSLQEYAKLSHFRCGVDDGYIVFVKGHYVIIVPRAQLKQVLNGKKEEASK